jgi:hypothetical protein
VDVLFTTKVSALLFSFSKFVLGVWVWFSGFLEWAARVAYLLVRFLHAFLRAFSCKPVCESPFLRG